MGRTAKSERSESSLQSEWNAIMSSLSNLLGYKLLLYFLTSYTPFKRGAPDASNTILG